jgi:hypothetical protein
MFCYLHADEAADRLRQRKSRTRLAPPISAAVSGKAAQRFEISGAPAAALSCRPIVLAESVIAAVGGAYFGVFRLGGHMKIKLSVCATADGVATR